MFTINEIKEKAFGYLELKNHINDTTAVISLNEGGRLKELKLKDKQIIKEIPNFDYKTSYASSILFPFASRIENGKYIFKEKEYFLNCNDKCKNALHGLVYNKKFKVVKQIENLNFASVIISYQEDNKNAGFPYTFNIQLTYTLFENEISLSVKIKNTDNKAFPFTLGWHPFFLCDNLPESILKFKSNQKIEFDKNLITKKVLDIKTEKKFKIEHKQLDDCFILNSDTIEFLTPNYQIEITSNQIENYLQLYTPKDLPLIAIEPMTGISNSHNNKIGLQILEPNNTYSLKWSVKINKKTKFYNNEYCFNK